MNTDNPLNENGISQARLRVMQVLEEENTTLEQIFPELFPGSTRKKRGPKRGTKVPAKYQHPDDASITWSGRGKTPVWLRELEKLGHSRMSFFISPSTPRHPAI